MCRNAGTDDSGRATGGRHQLEDPVNTVTRLREAAGRHLAGAEGQGLAEYALILALIAIVAIVALIFLGGQISTILSTVGNSV